MLSILPEIVLVTVVVVDVVVVAKRLAIRRALCIIRSCSSFTVVALALVAALVLTTVVAGVVNVDELVVVGVGIEASGGITSTLCSIILSIIRGASRGTSRGAFSKFVVDVVAGADIGNDTTAGIDKLCTGIDTL